ncbi:hypothetical protein C1H46_040521 [Malus baccata]|uniref:Uncharacterized protein n=1 Tax=Malus baccata TaxID=106549 RepID=A0A540KIA5_MALBA|nr:hypothetical protein C1H46_040521 [Malus baccata]
MEPLPTFLLASLSLLNPLPTPPPLVFPPLTFPFTSLPPYPMSPLPFLTYVAHSLYSLALPHHFVSSSFMALSLYSYLGHARFKFSFFIWARFVVRVGFVVASGLVPLPSACFHSGDTLLDQFGGCSFAPTGPAYSLPYSNLMALLPCATTSDDFALV